MDFLSLTCFFLALFESTNAFSPRPVFSFRDTSLAYTYPVKNLLGSSIPCSANNPAIRQRGIKPSKVEPHKVLAPSLASSTVRTPEDSHRMPWMHNSLRAMKDRFRTTQHEVWCWRTAALACLSSLVLFRKSMDANLATLWMHLITGQSLIARMFRSDSYEWCLAVAAFVVWIHGFWLADRVVHNAAVKGRIHPWRKFRLQDRFEADRRRRNRLKRTETDESNDIPDVMTNQSEWNRQAWRFELWVYVLPLLAWDFIAPRRHRRLAPFAAPTTLDIFGGVLSGLLLYDFLFFCGHILMHRIPFLYRHVHSKHHQVPEVRAGEIVRLSLVEEVVEVGYSIVALNLLGVHPLARSLYNCVITFLLTELHSGFDFPWSPQNVVPFGIVTGSRRHHYHHRHGRQYYQKFFFSFDRMFGFFQPNDGSLHGDSVHPNPYIPESWKK